MKRWWIILLLLLFFFGFKNTFAAQEINLSLNLYEKSYGINQSITGSIYLNSNYLNQGSKIGAIINNVQVAEIDTLNYFNLNNISYTVENKGYKTVGDSFAAGNFLINKSRIFGFRIPSSLSTVNSFYINLSASNAILKIDVGDDGIYEWISKGTKIGYQNEEFPTGYNENTTPDGAVDVRGNSVDRLCEDLNLSLNELFDRIEIRLNTKAKKISDGGNLYLSLDNIECDVPENTLTNGAYNLASCNINITNVRSGNYRLCAYSKTGLGNVVYYELPKKFGTLSNHYWLTLMQSHYSNMINGFISISSDKLKNSFSTYLNNCSGAECVIPLNINSNNTVNINLQSVLAKIDTVNKFDRLYNIDAINNSIKHSNPAILKLENFISLKTPGQKGNYTFKIIVDNFESHAVDLRIKEIPIARISVNSMQLGINETFVFSGLGSSSSMGNITNYTWYFDDNITRLGAIVNKTFDRIGNFTIKLIVMDSTGATSNPEFVYIKVLGYESALRTYINETRTKIFENEEYFESLNEEDYSFYNILGFADILEDSKLRLDLLETEYNTLINNNETNLSKFNRIYSSVNNIRTVIPISLDKEVIEQSIYPDESFINDNILDKYSKDSKSEVIRYNSNIIQENKIALVDINFLEGDAEKYIVVQKNINVADDYALIEDLSDVVDDINSVSVLNEDYQIDEINKAIIFSNLVTNDIIYYFKGDDLSSYGRSFILKLNKQDDDSEESCGDGVCQLAEDCPQDCQKVEINWRLYLVILAIILVVYYLFFTNGPGNLRKYIKLGKLSNKKDKLFSSDEDFWNLRSYIESSLKRGMKKQRIEEVLLGQGWTIEQIKHAFENKKI